jgi:hypothetical protein
MLSEAGWKTHVSYSEPFAVCRFLRWVAIYSRVVYVLADLVTGVVLRRFSLPKDRPAYRAIIVATQSVGAPEGRAPRRPED